MVSLERTSSLGKVELRTPHPLPLDRSPTPLLQYLAQGHLLRRGSAGIC